MKEIPLSIVRKGVKKYFDFISQCLDVIFFQENKGDAAVVIISIQEYNSLIETEHLLSTKSNRTRLQELINQISV